MEASSIRHIALLALITMAPMTVTHAAQSSCSESCTAANHAAADAPLATKLQAIVCTCAKRRLLIVGENHGTNETPDLVASLAKDAVAGRPVRLGLEMPADEQPALQTYIRSSGNATDRAKLLQGSFWASRDGRSSVAWLRLIESVRVLRTAGDDVDLFAMEPDYPDQATIEKQGGGLAFKEAGMAKSIRSALDNGTPNQLVIALMGNFHPRYGNAYPFAPAPGVSVTERLLPVSPYVLIPLARQTSAWNRMSDGFGVHSGTSTHAPKEPLPRLVTVIDKPGSPTVALLWLNTMTPAPPATASDQDGGNNAAPASP
ncbi:MAG: hypothetical protein WA777_10360 [Rhodanobacter sp.]